MSNLSVISLVVKLMTDRTFHRGKWEDRKFRYKFLLRCCCHPLITTRYFRALCELSDIDHLLEVNPTLPAKIHRPYLFRNSRTGFRVQAVLDHYHLIRSLPQEVRRMLNVSRETSLVRTEGKDGRWLDISCSPCGFDREGELMLILRFNGEVITRISFTLLYWQGHRMVFVGGLQGPAAGTGTAIIREATRACYGLFPRRLLCEVLSVVAGMCGAGGIVAVSEDNHVLRQLRYFYQKKGRFVARYSECWKSAGGKYFEGFWYLPPELPRKDAGEIPARKRAEYRRRNALLDEVRRGLMAAQQNGCDFRNTITLM